MKKQIVLTLIVVIVSLSSYSQTTRGIDKIFEFKLGMTIQEMEQVVDTSLLEEVDVKHSSLALGFN